MTLIEFIKSQIAQDNDLGVLVRDIQADESFPVGKAEEAMLTYLDIRTRYGGTNSTYQKFLKKYNFQKTYPTGQLDLDAKFTVLKTEKWPYYKANFPVDKVILVGTLTDLYKAYCIDSTSEQALYFDIKSSESLNSIMMVDQSRIYIGNVTQQVSIEQAIQLLESCS